MLVTKFAGSIALSAGLLFAASSQTYAEDYSKDEIKEIVREYILDNPEIIEEAIYLLQAKAEKAEADQAAESLKRFTNQLFLSDLDPIGGNPNGSITIVEFFDYNCGYCKRANETLQQLIENNPELKVVYKEWPILSETSATAAKISLALNLAYPEHYEAFHQALLKTRSIRSDEDVWKIVDKLKLPRSTIEANLKNEKVQQHLMQTTKLAQELGITGTPAFIVGDSILKGAYPIDDIQRAIDLASKK